MPVVPGVPVNDDGEAGDVRRRGKSSLPRRRWYVIPNGANAGIYFGSWNAPEHIRVYAEGISASIGRPTSEKCDDIDDAVDACERYDIEPIFRGPDASVLPFSHLPEQYGSYALVIGANVRDANAINLTTALTAADAAAAGAATVATAVAQAAAHEPPEALELPRQMVDNLAGHLFELYRRSDFEKRSQPPNTTADTGGRPSAFCDVDGTKLIMPADRVTCRVAQWFRDHAGGGPYAAIRDQKSPTGSPELKHALACSRASLRDMLAFGAEETDDDSSEYYIIARLARYLVPTFTTARAMSLQRPVVLVCGVEIPSPLVLSLIHI